MATRERNLRGDVSLGSQRGTGLSLETHSLRYRVRETPNGVLPVAPPRCVSSGTPAVHAVGPGRDALDAKSALISTQVPTTPMRPQARTDSTAANRDGQWKEQDKVKGLRTEVEDMRRVVNGLANLPQDIQKLREDMEQMKIQVSNRQDTILDLQDKLKSSQEDTSREVQDLAEKIRAQVTKVLSVEADVNEHIQGLRVEVTKIRSEARGQNLEDMRVEIQCLKEADKKTLDEVKDWRRSTTHQQRDFKALKAKVDEIEKDVAGLVRGSEVVSSEIVGYQLEEKARAHNTTKTVSQCHDERHEVIKADTTMQNPLLKSKEMDVSPRKAAAGGPVQSQPSSQKDPEKTIQAGDLDSSTASSLKQQAEGKASQPADRTDLSPLFEMPATGNLAELGLSWRMAEGQADCFSRREVNAGREPDPKCTTVTGNPLAAPLAQGWQSSDAAPNRKRSSSQPGHTAKVYCPHLCRQAPAMEVMSEASAAGATAIPSSEGKPVADGDQVHANGTARKRASSQPTGARQPMFANPPHPLDPKSRDLTLKLEDKIVQKKGANCSEDAKRAYYRSLYKEAHPDKGGTDQAVVWLQQFEKVHGTWYLAKQ